MKSGHITGYILMAGVTGFSDRQDVGYERKSRVEETPHFLARETGSFNATINTECSAQGLARTW